MKWMELELDKLKLLYQNSVTNFILIKFPNSKKFSAKEAEIYFAKKGVLVRGMSAYNLSNYLRVSLGTKKENKIVIEILKTFLRDFK